MATLQRFKFLATQCGVAPSPTRSPSPRTSPLVQFRPKKTTLKMLLSLIPPSRREQPLIHQARSLAADKDVAGRKLRDLFVTSSPVEEEEEKERPKGKTKEEVLAAKLNAAASSQVENNATPVWSRFSKRLLQRVWRPKLGTIPE
ncbi:hypothetical protein N665_0803s0003 [Sinapis alba]|nr:hypothetical protein N665_0803s0003 [Sinapis alba]